MRKHDKQSSRKLVLQTKNTLLDIKFDSINLVKHFLMQTGITDQTHHRCHMIIDFFIWCYIQGIAPDLPHHQARISTEFSLCLRFSWPKWI